MTHDYERHGVTTLFAALDVLDAVDELVAEPQVRDQVPGVDPLGVLVDAAADRDVHDPHQHGGLAGRGAAASGIRRASG